MRELLSSRLAKQALSGWQIRETKRRSYQSFLAQNELECMRTVDSVLYEVTLYKERPVPGGLSVLGLSTFRTGASDVVAVDALIEKALVAAELVSNQPFQLPAAGAAYPGVDIVEKETSPALLKTLEDRLKAAVSKEKNVRLSAAEFFIDRFETRLINHQGLDVEQEETVLHTEFILLAKHDHQENEYINRTSRRLLKDFHLEAEVAESAEFARNATLAVVPPTGRFPVLMTGEPLDHLFNPVLARASARLKYNKMLDIQTGKMVTDGASSGDVLTLWSRGLLPGALGTNRFDSYGTPAQDVKLIDKNKVVALLADQRYGQYLHIPVTGELGTLDIEPGQQTIDKLLQVALQKSPKVIVLNAFSAFEPNPITGAYSAEIRAGFLVTPQGRTPLKGGSVSGVIQKDLTACHLSKERDFRERIRCPKGVLFQSLSIAGAA